MVPSAVSGDVLEAGQLGPLAEFELDVQVTTDAAVGYASRGCNTDDTCGSTCASACTSS